MITITSLNPYMIYIKIGVIVILVTGLGWLGWHEKSVRADLDKYKADAALQKATTEMYAQQFNDYIKLNKEIADAIKKVKVQSNTYIDSVEASPAPAVADGDTVVLIAPGLPKGMSGVPGYQNYSAGGAAATTAGSTSG